MTRPPQSRARPLLREADFAARGRRLAERKARDHLRACEHRDARGEVQIWVWVPAVHADLIRGLVPVLGAALVAGCPPRQILSWIKATGATTENTTQAEAGIRIAPDGEGTPCDWSGESKDPDDPAAWQGSGIKARRRAQSRRAAARKKAQGLKRISIVVSKAHKAAITFLIGKITRGLQDGLTPRIERSAAARIKQVESRPDQAEADTCADADGGMASSLPGLQNRETARHIKENLTSQVPMAEGTSRRQRSACLVQEGLGWMRPSFQRTGKQKAPLSLTISRRSTGVAG